MATNNTPEIKRDGTDICPKCGGHIVMVEYDYNSPFHYDGVSEYACANAYETGGKACDYKIGRFCGKVIGWKESEPAYCEGGPHPVHL